MKVFAAAVPLADVPDEPWLVISLTPKAQIIESHKIVDNAIKAREILTEHDRRHGGKPEYIIMMRCEVEVINQGDQK